MSDPIYPADWNHECTLSVDLMAVVVSADCGWLQAVTDTGFMLMAVILGCEDDELRIAATEAMAERMVEAARTGKMPGVSVQ